MTAPLTPIRVAGGMILSDEVYARIGAAILDGTLPPGEQLRDIDLAAQLGVSRTPVREALQRLERFGLVEVAVGRYTRVSEPTDQVRNETGELATYLMGNALRIALGRCTAEQHSLIVGMVDAVLARVQHGDAMAVIEASSEMFAVVAKASGNAIFMGVIGEADLTIQRNLRGWRPFLDGPAGRAEGYTQLRALIAERDGDGAERLLRRLHGFG